MLIGQLFEVGSRWKHREREFLVVIQHVLEPGRFTLGFAEKQSLHDTFEADWASDFILRGSWTAEDLLKHFDPMPLRPTRYELLLDGLEEDDAP